MTCDEIRDLIPTWVRGELDEDTRRAVEEHLKNCPDCRDEALRQTLSGGAAEDPPEGYWDDYNGRLKSRLRGTFGMLWSLGCLPGALMGLVAGFAVVIILWFVIPDHMPGGWFVGIAVLIAIALLIGLILRSALRRADRRLSPIYERDESAIKRLIRTNPGFKIAFILATTALNIGMAAFIALMYAGMDCHMASTPRVTLISFAFLGFVISCEMYTIQYIQAERGGRVRASTLSRVISAIAFAALMALLLWEMSINNAMDVPWTVTHKAKAAYQAGKTQTAVHALQKCIREHSESPNILDCYELLGEIYTDQHKPEQARAVYLDGIRAYKRLRDHPHYIYTKSDRASLALDASMIYRALGNEEKADELDDLYDRLMMRAEP